MDFNLKVDFNDKGEIKCKEEEEESRNDIKIKSIIQQEYSFQYLLTIPYTNLLCINGEKQEILLLLEIGNIGFRLDKIKEFLMNTYDKYNLVHNKIYQISLYLSNSNNNEKDIPSTTTMSLTSLLPILSSSLNKFKTQIGYLQQQIEMIIHELYLLTFKLNEFIQRHIVIINKQEELENYELRSNSLLLARLELHLIERIFYILSDAQKSHSDNNIKKPSVNNERVGDKNNNENNNDINDIDNTNNNNTSNENTNNNNTSKENTNNNNTSNDNTSNYNNLDNKNTTSNNGNGSDRYTNTKYTKIFENWKDVYILIKNDVNKRILSEEKQEVCTQGLSEGKQNYMDIINIVDSN